jgi:hypothetical protein
MFTNHFTGPAATLDEQHHAILQIIARGILSESERTHWKYAPGTDARNGT